MPGDAWKLLPGVPRDKEALGFVRPAEKGDQEACFPTGKLILGIETC